MIFNEFVILLTQVFFILRNKHLDQISPIYLKVLSLILIIV
jgi:hypothetical protein